MAAMTIFSGKFVVGSSGAVVAAASGVAVAAGAQEFKASITTISTKINIRFIFGLDMDSSLKSICWSTYRLGLKRCGVVLELDPVMGVASFLFPQKICLGSLVCRGLIHQRGRILACDM
jgi:hypothetical protein